MEPVRYPRVKICCISSHKEANLAIALGAAAIGLVSAMPTGPGVIPDDTIRSIAASVPPPIATFLLTSRQDAREIIDQQRRLGCSVLQLVDRVNAESHRQIGATLPGVKRVQVVHVTGAAAVPEAIAIAAEVDALLLDSGDPGPRLKQLGGTGRRHDWSLSRRIREVVAIPVFLAGGLNPGNVREAIDEVAPFGLDVCTGVRTDGHLDARRLEAFMRAAGA